MRVKMGDVQNVLALKHFFDRLLAISFSCLRIEDDHIVTFEQAIAVIDNNYCLLDDLLARLKRRI